MARRRENRQRQRGKRRETRRRPEPRQRQVERELRSIMRALQEPPPASWPGVSDPSLRRPDLVKAEFGEFIERHRTARAQMKELEERVAAGPLGFFPDIEHWAMEEYFYHGLPEETWRALDAFLEKSGDRFPPPAQEQLRLWGQARIGTFEVGAVENDLVTLTEWDLVRGKRCGEPTPAITLNLGGVNIYGKAQGQVAVMYLAPWSPREGIACGMGYGITAPKADAALLLPLLGLRRPEAVATPLPWSQNPASMREHLARWRRRDWYAWLQERLEFPFRAVVGISPTQMEVCEVRGLAPITGEQAKQFGVYFEIPREEEVLLAGASAVTPLDLASKNMAALLEYHAFRKRVGPPPGMIGRPPLMEFR